MTTTAPAPTDIRETLSELRGATIYHPLGTGNAGDALINVATIQVFRSLGLRVNYLTDRATVPDGQVIVCSGGGNLVPLYRNLANFIRAHHRTAKRLIVLPHSYGGHEELLSELGDNTLLVCREPRSLDYLRSLGLRAHVALSEDMALHLDVGRVLRGGTDAAEDRDAPLDLEAWRDRLKFAVRSARRRRACLRASDGDGGRRVLNAFRADAERTGQPPPPGNFDVSGAFATRSGRYTPGSALRCARALLRFLDGFDEIRTDRLHVSIAGLLLGKHVAIWPNNYHKVESIYHYSLKHRFPEARWMGG